jgi:NADP-dependent 3-hydroxy acid dehydrogenase YdfG
LSETSQHISIFLDGSGKKETSLSVFGASAALTSSVGHATAIAFAKEGANVVVSGRHDHKGGELLTELRSLSSQSGSTF